VNVTQILSIDKALLTDRVRPLPAATMARVDNGLRLALGL
jgi:mRNA-degrading endonuclease toxin of MazEF toxin-antitoxin module